MESVPAEPPFDLAATWRAARYPVLGILVVLALLTILAIVGTSNDVPLDPRNTAPDGAHALSVLLTDRGVAVSVVSSADHVQPNEQTTVLVSDAAALSPRAARLLATSNSTILLVSPPQDILDAMGVPATTDDRTLLTTLPPTCGIPAAVTAGEAQIAGNLYAVSPGQSTVSQCYFGTTDPALLESARPNGAKTIVLGSGSTLSNQRLGNSGNAALVLGLTDNARVAWVPAGLALGPVPRSRQGLLNLLPSRLLWATLQVFIALAVLALWRARRLGRPVVEPLPVVVRASETVEGRGRLMHAARTRDTAASALQVATTNRLRTALQVGEDDDAAAVIAVVADQTGRAPTDIASLLYGDEPPDDEALVQLAQDLSRLEAAVRRDDTPSTRRPTVNSGTS